MVFVSWRLLRFLSWTYTSWQCCFFMSWQCCDFFFNVVTIATVLVMASYIHRDNATVFVSWRRDHAVVFVSWRLLRFLSWPYTSWQCCFCVVTSWQCYGFCVVTIATILDNAMLPVSWRLLRFLTMLCFLCRDDCYSSCHGLKHRDNASFCVVTSWQCYCFCVVMIARVHVTALNVVTVLCFLCRDDCYGSCHGLKHRDNATVFVSWRRDNAIVFCVVRIDRVHVTALNVVTVLCFLCRDDCYGSCHGLKHRENATFFVSWRRDNAIVFLCREDR